MKKLITLSSLLFSCFVFTQNSDLVRVKSVYSFEETVSKIKESLEEKNINIFSVINHKTNAEEVDLELNPTTIIVFGSPKAGTLLMQENQNIAIELPLKISIIKNDKKEVWVSYFKIDKIAKKYNLEKHPIIDKMQILLKNLVKIIQ